MLIGEGKPYLSVLTNLNHEQWKKLAAEKGYAADASAVHDPAVEKFLLARIAAQMKEFPGYAQSKTACSRRRSSCGAAAWWTNSRPNSTRCIRGIKLGEATGDR